MFFFYSDFTHTNMNKREIIFTAQSRNEIDKTKTDLVASPGMSACL